MKLTAWKPALLFAVLSVALVAMLQHSMRPSGETVIADRKVEPFRLPSLTDAADTFSIDDLRAHPVSVVNFWASWCPGCREEMPQLAALKRESGVPIYGINYKDPRAGAEKMLADLGNPFNKVGIDNSGTTFIDWGVYGIPETFIVRRVQIRPGESVPMIVYKHIGPIDDNTLNTVFLPKLRALVAETATQAAPAQEVGQ